nr:cyclase family protein [Paracoccaceae bacterium]
MCTTCLMNDVKARMLSRRDLFRGAGAAGVAAASFGLAPVALAQGHAAVEDLTHELTEDFPTFFGDQQFFVEKKFDFAADGFNLFELRVNEHTGTHMDAPLHFSADGQSVAEIPVGNLVVPLCVVDIRAKVDADADAQVTPDDLSAWIAANGDIPDRACVAMLSGWQTHFGTDRFRNADAAGAMHFPGFHMEAAQMLMEQTGAVGIAVDTLSLDHGASPDFAAHYAW